MIETTFAKSETGVDVRLQGDVEKATFEAMAAECNGGQCSCKCDSSLKEQVKGVSISGRDGDITLSLQGIGLEPETVAAAMKACDMEAR